jgi:hypothetical protein
VTLRSDQQGDKVIINLQNLGVFAVTVSSDINKIHGEFDKNYTQLIACGATVDDPIGILFDAYSVVPCYNFKQYIKHQHEDNLDGRLTRITHKNLMIGALCKYNYLKVKGQWGARSPNNKKIVTMLAQLIALKGQLKLNKKLGKLVDKKKEGGGKKKNKKNTSNKVNQKNDEAWKKVPPKDGKKKTKDVKNYSYNWCKHHMSWIIQFPAECRLGKQHKEEQNKPKPSTTVCANAATYAAATTTQVNPHFQAMLATLASDDKE